MAMQVLRIPFTLFHSVSMTSLMAPKDCTYWSDFESSDLGEVFLVVDTITQHVPEGT